jgi:hypothetical protein
MIIQEASHRVGIMVEQADGRNRKQACGGIDGNTLLP